MPKAEEKRRGGASKHRTIRLKDGRVLHIAIVPKAGPRGGHTVAGRPHKPKG